MEVHIGFQMRNSGLCLILREQHWSGVPWPRWALPILIDEGQSNKSTGVWNSCSIIWREDQQMKAHRPKNGPTPWDIVAKTPKLEWTWSAWPAWVLRLQLSNEGWQWNSCRNVFVFGCCWNLYSLFWVDLFKVSSCTFDGNIRKSPPQLVEPLQDDWGVQPFPARVTQWPC